ncbi:MULTISPECIES: protein translocase subunit SecD [Subtercola]|uniref:Protein translocase subunit SecD n=1 Tax=Subtercola vilae TaxID=2056433 RepID=A0A4T2C121_9MICO|nr:MULTISPECIES: protein translocase subunit SecD [Subtercola]MEA9985125.1 protein translocase subunit SecD [Subtercola sp. RTI3]TIH37677.1 protein translocase subunit SecD [Subtercola vilae]
MAKSTAVKRARRTLVWLLVIFIALAGVNAAGALWGGGSWAPKLALDLEGGTEIILAPKLASGETVSDQQVSQAVSIIRQRVDASGVSEAQISTQGGQNIVVSIPGTPDDATLQRIEASAKLDFRAVLVSDTATVPTTTPTAGLDSTPTASPTNASDLAWVTPALEDQFLNIDCSSTAATDAGQAPAAQPLVACGADGAKYILGPVEVAGDTISNATSGVATTSSGSSTGQFVVNIFFNDKGTSAFAAVTTRLSGLTGAQNQFAIVLDGKVISAPRTLAVITNGEPQISGNFDANSSKTLADQLKFGALPISFTVQSQNTISATLGSTQLLSGLIAGLIGLILVVLYSIAQYRVLGAVTIASLVVAGTLTFLVVDILSWRAGYRLSLAGVAGLIVAIGITADSFIVYFERIRDELRDGRGLESSVQAGWKRAIRTIFASDLINLMAAVVLYIVAVGSVKGFALTLGLTTIIDLVVVMMFTHPIMTLLAELPYFRDGHKTSGLDPRQLGAVYRGRAQFKTPASNTPRGKQESASREAARRQTIAERKAAGSSTLVIDAPAADTNSTDTNSADAKNKGKKS